MKLFHFDPTTGKRGGFIEHARRLAWTGQSVEFQVANNIIEPIECVLPKSADDSYIPDLKNGDKVITLHVDAGIEPEVNEFKSYRHPTEWRMMCEGRYLIGTGQYCKGEYWKWVILPPTNLIIKIGEQS